MQLNDTQTGDYEGSGADSALVLYLRMLFEERIRLVTVVTCAFWPAPTTCMYGFIRQSAGTLYSPHPYDERCTTVLAWI